MLPGARILRTEFRREIKDRFTFPLTSANRLGLGLGLGLGLTNPNPTPNPNPNPNPTRLKLILSVLEAPVKRPVAPGQRAGGVGGGLDLEALQSSGRVQDVFLMHDDDESEVRPEHTPDT